MFDSIQRANRVGVTFVAAAGNNNQNTDSNPQFPAAYNSPNVISVAATDRWDQRATFSNFGRNTVDIGAPGVGIISTLLNNNYGSMDGTSMAAPHVAGVAALLYAQNQNRSATEIRDLLLQSGDSVNSLQNITATGRRLNANKAVIRGMIGEGSRAPALFRGAFDNVLGSNYDFAPIGNAYRWGNGWTQELRDPRGNRVLIMLEDGATTAYTVFGSNLDEYLVLGGPVGRMLDGRSVTLGYPRSNENVFTNPRDGRRAVWQQFAADNGKSRIHNLNGSASVATWGTIGSLYTDMSGASGWLGMPTRREYFDGDTVFSDFQGGRIAYGWNNGRVEALRPGEQPSWRRQFFSETVGLGQWYADVFRWNGSAQPPTNFSTDRANLLATLNLGSSTRNDGKQGLNQDWGMGSLRDSRLPNDAFAVRSYTQARFEAGKTYRAWVRADDGYQLFAKRANTNEWYYFTPRDEWKTDAYGTHRAIEFQVPISGDYDFHFQYYEGGGNAYFDLFWEEVRTQPSGLMSLSQKLAELMSGQWNGRDIDVDKVNGSQCWDLVAYATGNISKTTTWRRGANVIANGSVAIGTAIATFLGPNNSYDHPNLQQHTAIFAGYGNENGVSGFYVWDQNFDAFLNGDLSIKKHFIRTNRSGTSDADNYYVVQV